MVKNWSTNLDLCLTFASKPFYFLVPLDQGVTGPNSQLSSEWGAAYPRFATKLKNRFAPINRLFIEIFSLLQCFAFGLFNYSDTSQ